jgi:hypothetical protein
MFERLTQHAQQFATDLNVSRRGFLGRAGRGALAVAGALGVLLAAPNKARCHSAGDCAHCRRDCKLACGGDTSCYDLCFFECCFSPF